MKSKKQETPVKNRRLDGYALAPFFFNDHVTDNKFVTLWLHLNGKAEISSRCASI